MMVSKRDVKKEVQFPPIQHRTFFRSSSSSQLKKFIQLHPVRECVAVVVNDDDVAGRKLRGSESMSVCLSVVV